MNRYKKWHEQFNERHSIIMKQHIEMVKKQTDLSAHPDWASCKIQLINWIINDDSILKIFYMTEVYPKAIKIWGKLK